MFCDLAYWASQPGADVERGLDLAERWIEGRFPKVVQAAARLALTSGGREVGPRTGWLPELQLLSNGRTGDPDELAVLVAEETVASLVATERLVESQAGLHHLLDLWRNGPLLRSELVREAVAAGLTDLTAEDAAATT